MSVESAPNTNSAPIPSVPARPRLPQECELLAPQQLWTPLKRDNFPVGSFGRAYFPDPLEGRKRPSTILKLPLIKLFKFNKPKALAELSAAGIHTCADALNQPSARLQSKLTTDHLTRFLHDLTVTPQGRLLAEVTGKPAIPVSLEKEMEFVAAVDDAVAATLILPEDYKLNRLHAAKVPSRKTPVDQRFELWLLLVRLFGLVDGIPLSSMEVSKMREFNINDSLISIKKNRAIGQLIHGKINGHNDPLEAARKILALSGLNPAKGV